MNREIGIIVEVAKKRDGKAIQLGGPSPQLYLFPNNSRTIRFNQESVDAKCRHTTDSGQLEKLSPVYWKKGQ